MVIVKRLSYLYRTVVGLQLVVLAWFGIQPLATGIVSAAELPSRSVNLSSSTIGGPAQHTFSFRVPSTLVIGSMSFEYCTNSPFYFDPCVAPAGLDLSSNTLTSQSGNTGFTISAPDSTANKIVITRPAAAGNTVQSTYTFDSIINPTTVNQTTFVRLTTYISTDGTGAPNDYGAVAFVTTQNFQVDAYVPPFIIFCVGVSVTLNCNSAAGTRIDVGELGEDTTATASLQFSGATNDESGYTTYLNGLTMTSGNNIITPLATASTSAAGTSQFGLNLRANTDPVVGQDPIGAGSSAPNAGYGTPNVFRFVDGEAITNTTLPTDFRLFTASFIVNVPANQPPGIYATTMTLTAIASF